MIIVREVFTCKPGFAGKFAKMFKEFNLKFYPNEKVKVMTDVVGDFNTVVMETEMNNLAEFEMRMAAYKYDSQNKPEMQEMMKDYLVSYQTGKREIWQVV